MANQLLKKISYQDGNNTRQIQVESAVRDGSGNIISTFYQPKHSHLTDISGLSGNGFLVKSGASITTVDSVGTVKSVRVQAGTGLTSSTSTAQSSTLDTTIGIASGYKLPTTSEWEGKVTSDGVVLNQANTVIVQNALKNISGKTLTSFSASEVPLNGYTVIQIKKNNSVLNETDAKTYMAAQTGSYFLPVYDYDNPKFTYFIFTDGRLYKPQFDATNGLVLYYMNQLAFASDISTYITTAPSSANTSGKVKIVVLDSEPSTKYSGYIYLITGSNA